MRQGINRGFAAVVVLATFLVSVPLVGQTPRWRQHDMRRPRPVQVTPGRQVLPVPPPSDATVLFDGKDLSTWQSPGGEEPKWTVQDGAMFPQDGAGMIETKQGFGDVQLHAEWQSPTPANGKGQDRGNSGIYFMSKYEVQVLDSYQNETYADGQAAAIYGQSPPLVNASRPPGEWQSYDVVFRAPRFSEDGSVERPAQATVFHNGVLVQDHFPLRGATMWLQTIPYMKHPDKLPIALQDHGDPVRYRNIWVRELAPVETTVPGPSAIAESSTQTPDAATLQKLAGVFHTDEDGDVRFEVRDGQLEAHAFSQVFALQMVGPREWDATATDIRFQFSEDGNYVTIDVMGEAREARRVD